MRSSMRLPAPKSVCRSGIACCTSTAQSIDGAGKFHQHAVAGGLDDAAMVLGDFRIEELATQRLQAFERAFLVHPHQPRIAGDIGGEDGSETTDGGHLGLALVDASRLTETPGVVPFCYRSRQRLCSTPQNRDAKLGGGLPQIPVERGEREAVTLRKLEISRVIGRERKAFGQAHRRGPRLAWRLIVQADR